MTSSPAEPRIPPPAQPPRRWAPQHELPSYRYLPGLLPHPFRDPAGHAWSGGGPPPELPWQQGQPWQEDQPWLWGVDLFNHRYYWESHEVWEGPWKQLPRSTPQARLLQGLILASAALIKRTLGQQQVAERLHLRSLNMLSIVLLQEPLNDRGLELRELRQHLEERFSSGGWPVLELRS